MTQLNSFVKKNRNRLTEKENKIMVTKGERVKDALEFYI